MNTASLSSRGSPTRRTGDGRAGAWRVFEAIFQPGRVRSVGHIAPVPPLTPAATAVCRALMNAKTPMWTDAHETEELAADLQRRYGIPMTRDMSEAAFALITNPREIPALLRFRQGSVASPESSTTLAIEVQRLIEGTGRRLSGPGLESELRLQIGGLDMSFWSQLRTHNARYPCGMDVILTCGRRLAALPRWTTVEV